MNATAEQRECKMSKQGWPLGTYKHNLGFTYAAYAAPLIQKIKSKYGLDAVFTPYQHDARMGELHATARLSMERYAVVRAFIEGFNANQ